LAFTHPPTLFPRYSTEHEDPSLPPLTASQIEQIEQGTGDQSEQRQSMDQDSGYLTFKMPIFHFVLLDESVRRVTLGINAQLQGMFFLAKPQGSNSPDSAPPPPELTCYRRNIFQITGFASLPRGLRYIWTEDDARIPIVGLELAVSASESVEGNAVKLISVPFKTPSGTEPSKPEDKVEREPATIPLDSLGGQDMDELMTHPIQWKRLQFRIATANNGRRKELQQHFTLKLKVIATLSTHAKYAIAEAESQPIIVRGRSPRNFASRNDVPLSTGSAARKHIPSMARNSSSQTSMPNITSAPQQLTPPPIDPPQLRSQYHGNSPADVAQWQQSVPMPDRASTPTFTNRVIPPTGMPYMDDTLDINQGLPYGLHGIPAQGNEYAHSLYLDSEDGSPLPPLARQNSRPPTSNPSPSLTGQAHTSMSQIKSPTPPSDLHKRFRPQSYQPSNMPVLTMASAPTSHPFSSPQLFDQGRTPPYQNMPFTPDGSEVDFKLHHYVPEPEERELPDVDPIYRPHGIHHYVDLPHQDQAFKIESMGQESGIKRQYSQTG
jgi:hypothetical protein